MSHPLHAAVIDRGDRLVVNIEGNRFTSDQPGDLVKTVLSQGKGSKRAHHFGDKRQASPDHRDVFHHKR